jgi:hypothetical protein
LGWGRGPPLKAAGERVRFDGIIGGVFPFALLNAAHNLPFIHAYAVLNDVLERLAYEGHFTCKSIFLGELLKRSEQALRWHDFALISAGATRRNDVAHRGQLLDRGDCWKYVDAVKVELSAWGVI